MTEIDVEPVVAEPEPVVTEPEPVATDLIVTEPEPVLTDLPEAEPVLTEPSEPTKKARAKRQPRPEKPKAAPKRVARKALADLSRSSDLTQPPPSPEPEPEPSFIPSIDQHLRMWYDAQRMRETQERQARYASFRLL